MPYRNKTYVAFDGDTDMRYYTIMKAWRQNDNIDFNFYDAHDINDARDSSTEETIKRRLRERMICSKIFVLLIGENTKNLYRFVRWEIDIALSLDLPIICVNINGNRDSDNLCPAILNNKLAVFVSFKQQIIQYAMDNWPSSHSVYKKECKSEHYHYVDSVYNKLGI